MPSELYRKRREKKKQGNKETNQRILKSLRAVHLLVALNKQALKGELITFEMRLSNEGQFATQC